MKFDFSPSLKKLNSVFLAEGASHQVDSIDVSCYEGKTLLVAITERSGSTMLCDLLAQTNLVGNPTEYLNPRGVIQHNLKSIFASNIVEYICNIRSANSKDGVFSLKTNYWDLEPLLSVPRLCGCLFGDVTVVYLTREDIVMQAISSYRARQSKVWHIKEGESRPEGSITFNEQEILQLVDRLIKERLNWEKLFSVTGIKPLRVSYEELVEDYSGVIKKILQFANISYSETLIDSIHPRFAELKTTESYEWAKAIRHKNML